MVYPNKIENIDQEWSSHLKDDLKTCQNHLENISHAALNLGILALNANIEAIHAAHFLDDFENVISENMLIQAKMLAKTLAKFHSNNNPNFIEQILYQCGFDGVYITDELDITVYSNVESSVGKKLSTLCRDPKLKDTLEEQDGVILPREELYDGNFKKTVLVPRIDVKGYIQIEFSYIPPRGRLTIDSFSVVAEEIRRQSIKFQSILTKIQEIMRKLMEEDQNFTYSNHLVPFNHISDASDQSYLNIDNASRIIKCYLNEIIQISKLTNLLGIRAKIEAAQSTNYVGDFDKLLNRLMLTEAYICYYFFPDGEMSYEDAINFATLVGIDEFWVTNKFGIVEITNSIEGKGFQFTHDGQTAPFMVLLEGENHIVTCPPAARTLDGKVFKYVGISRSNGGILQIGRKAELYGENTATGFMIVADDVKTLSEKTQYHAMKIIEMLK